MKSLAADDDDFYDDDDFEEEYGEQEELSAEDREQLRLGTIKVRESLPSSTYYIPEKEIHDALWNYYYDIAKTVTYLKSESQYTMLYGLD